MIKRVETGKRPTWVGYRELTFIKYDDVPDPNSPVIKAVCKIFRNCEPLEANVWYRSSKLKWAQIDFEFEKDENLYSKIVRGKHRCGLMTYN